MGYAAVLPDFFFNTCPPPQLLTADLEPNSKLHIRQLDPCSKSTGNWKTFRGATRWKSLSQVGMILLVTL